MASQLPDRIRGGKVLLLICLRHLLSSFALGIFSKGEEIRKKVFRRRI